MGKDALLTKRYSLNCSHLISACENGFDLKTKETSFHGHSIELFVTIKGKVNTESGQIISRDYLDSVIKSTILDKYHKKNLNNLIAIPTGENIIKHIHDDLVSSEISNIYHQSQIKETSKNLFSSPINSHE